MERKQIANVVIPAVAVAALIALVALVVVAGGGPDGTKSGGTPADRRASSDTSAEGMTEKLPPLDGADWKDIGGGLKVWDVKEGDGEPVLAGAMVKAHYRGWLTDGTSFDASTKHGPDPSEFSLNGVVQGWTRGLPGMKPGGVRRLYIPSELGYGAKGRPGIPPNADLVFEVKLVSWSTDAGPSRRR